MNRVRALLKKFVFDHAPHFGGRLRYYGTTVYAPRGNHVVELLLGSDDGVYERQIVRRITSFLRPSSTFFDIGANIGLMSLPPLYEFPDVQVAAFEPSPNSASWLAKTIAGSGYADRWRLIRKALAEHAGTAEFQTNNPAMGAFDGLRDTKRPEVARIPSQTVTVELSTADAEWNGLDRPDVSVVKIDVEGAELGVLQGATELIGTCRPIIVTEWSPKNLPAYGTDIRELYRFAVAHSYLLFTAEAGVPVRNEAELDLQIQLSESFLLFPAEGVRQQDRA